LTIDEVIGKQVVLENDLLYYRRQSK